MVRIARERLEGAGLDGAATGSVSKQGLWEYWVPSRLWVERKPSTPNGPDPDAYPILEYRNEEDEQKLSRPDGSCLESFIRLDEGPEEEFPDRVLDFAKRWGPLGICEHGKPAAHHDGCNPLGSRVRGETQPDGFSAYLHWEPLEAWARYVKHLAGLFSLGVELCQDQPGRMEDWAAVKLGESGRLNLREREDGRNVDDHWPLAKTQDGKVIAARPLTEPNDLEFISLYGAPLTGQRAMLAHALDVWDRYGRVRLETRWPDGAERPRQRRIYSRLPGILALELRAALESEIEPTRCYGCGRATSPRRKPRYRNGVKERTWCKRTPRCDANAQVRDHQRRVRGRRGET